jgi:hypothetical protein
MYAMRKPYTYNDPEHLPEDQSWGWLILLVVGGLAVAAGVLIAWPAAIAVLVVAALALILRRVRRRRVSAR